MDDGETTKALDFSHRRRKVDFFSSMHGELCGMSMYGISTDVLLKV
jgi:hypothetical protein